MQNGGTLGRHRDQILDFVNCRTMKIVTNFLLRKNRKADDGKSSVCVRVTYLGNRIELATEIYSSTDHWDESR